MPRPQDWVGISTAKAIGIVRRDGPSFSIISIVAISADRCAAFVVMWYYCLSSLESCASKRSQAPLPH